ncbi:putative bifunctional diguanylate cyclase/phosphodiesterase [Panacagrimonas perspica]|nr:EAL domain-containing protein [Panacagrimonas perspica]
MERALHVAANAMFIADRNGRIRWVNAAFTRLYGFAAEEVLGSTPRVLKSGRQTSAFYRELWTTVRAGKVWRGHLSNRHKNGEVLDVDQTITPVCDEHGKPTHYYVVYEDITERLRSEQQLTQLAMFDSLTGLPNRNQFHIRLSEAFARSRRSAKPMAVLLLDLDHFKNVNDTLGHAGGDELLAKVGRCLTSALRDTDVVARLSGDEFAVLVEDLARPDQAIDSARRLLDVLSSSYKVLGATIQVGASIGIALSGDLEDTPERLLRNADLAMYRAKSRGRNCFQFFDAAMDLAARKRYDLRDALRTALRKDEFKLCFQPQVDMRTGMPVGAEALLRWNDPHRGLVTASEFIGVAEQDGMISALNDWVLRAGFAEVARLHRVVPSMVPVSINVSAGQFDRTDLAPTIESLLREHDLPATAIRLEITETVMLRSSLAVHENIRQLGRLGVTISVDDFGTGYSSLPALREFPIGTIKLDMSYVRGIGRSARDELLLCAIIGIARMLKLGVVAEGVETAAQRDFLIREGCFQAQGHLYQRALPAEEFAAWMRFQQRSICAASMASAG